MPSQPPRQVPGKGKAKAARTGADRAKAMLALQIRMSGATLEQTAERAGYSSTHAVWNALKNLIDSTVTSDVAEYRAFHVARLERLLLGVWNSAIGGDFQSSQQALKILVEIGKVTGVEAPIKVEATGPGGGPIQAQMTFEPNADWVRRYTEAWAEVRASHALPVGNDD